MTRRLEPDGLERLAEEFISATLLAVRSSPRLTLRSHAAIEVVSSIPGDQQAVVYRRAACALAESFPNAALYHIAAVTTAARVEAWPLVEEFLPEAAASAHGRSSVSWLYAVGTAEARLHWYGGTMEDGVAHARSLSTSTWLSLRHLGHTSLGLWACHQGDEESAAEQLENSTCLGAEAERGWGHLPPQMVLYNGLRVTGQAASAVLRYGRFLRTLADQFAEVPWLADLLVNEKGLTAYLQDLQGRWDFQRE